MIFPSKLIPFKDSLLYKSIYIVKLISKSPRSINKLYFEVEEFFEDINEFIMAIELLYVLEYINFDPENEVIKYVGKN